MGFKLQSVGIHGFRGCGFFGVRGEDSGWELSEFNQGADGF